MTFEKNRDASRAALFIFGAALPFHAIVKLGIGPSAGLGDLLFCIPLFFALRDLGTLRRDRALLLPLVVMLAGFLPTLAFSGNARSAAQIAVFSYTALLFFVGARAARADLGDAIRNGFVVGVCLNVMIALGGVAAFAGGGSLYFADQNWAPEVHGGVIRLRGVTESPNMLATEITVAIFLCLFARRAVARRSSFASAKLALLGAGLVGTLGHNSIAGALAICVYIAYTNRGALIRGASIALSALSGVALVALVFFRGIPLSRAAPFVDLRTSPYLVCHAAAIAMFRAHPFAGVGLERFHEAWPTYVDRALEARAFEGSGFTPPAAFDPHSTYLGYAAEAGIFGVFVLCALAVLLLRVVKSRAFFAPELRALCVFVFAVALVMDVMTSREIFLGLGLLSFLPRAKSLAA